MLSRIHQEVLAHNGTFEKKEESQAAASYYHIPGGYDVMNCYAVKVYFASEEDRDAFVLRNADRDELAAFEEL